MDVDPIGVDLLSRKLEPDNRRLCPFMPFGQITHALVMDQQKRVLPRAIVSPIRVVFASFIGN